MKRKGEKYKDNENERELIYLRLAVDLGASTRGAVAGDGVTAAAATAAAAAADGEAAPNQLQGIVGNLYPILKSLLQIVLYFFLFSATINY
jgi:hypothetical protein